MLHALCNLYDNENECHGHFHDPIYDNAYINDDTHPNDGDDYDDADYDYAPAASMEGNGKNGGSIAWLTLTIIYTSSIP
jgi:hypothetical protein